MYVYDEYGQEIKETEEQAAKRKERNKKAAARRKERNAIMRSCGLVKVKGAMSGKTYWE